MVASMRTSFQLQLLLLCVTNTRAFLHSTIHPQRHHNPSWSSPACTCARYPSSNNNAFAFIEDAFSLHARPKSKWDSLVDDDDDDDGDATSAIDEHLPPDMTDTEANIRRQADTYDRLEAVGGRDAVKDVYVRAPGQKEWWLIGKIAHVSDVTPAQAIERQWPLIARHAWALRLPPQPPSNVDAPFEAWYAPGDTEQAAARNDPALRFTRAFNGEARYGGDDVPAACAGFVGRTYDARRGDPVFFVERNVVDGSCREGWELQGDWVLQSE